MNNYFYDKEGNLSGSSTDVINRLIKENNKLKKENEENIEFAKLMMDWRDELIKENAELKKENSELKKLVEINSGKVIDGYVNIERIQKEIEHESMNLAGVISEIIRRCFIDYKDLPETEEVKGILKKSEVNNG